MSGESPKKIGRGYQRNLEAGPFQPMIDSWDLHLRAERKSAKTVRTYLEAAQWFAAGYLIPADITGWEEVKARRVQEWIITLLGRYSDCYANNQFRALQQFFKWHATEDPDEQRPNPMVGLKPPKIGDKLVPVFTDDELAGLLGTCKGGGFQNRRDYAIISVFKDTGARLSELAGLATGDVSPRDREAVVTGKGDKQRTVRFTYDTARALDRYQRERAKHKMARVGALWLGVRGGPMTASGVGPSWSAGPARCGCRAYVSQHGTGLATASGKAQTVKNDGSFSAPWLYRARRVGAWLACRRRMGRPGAASALPMAVADAVGRCLAG
jgi:site-specific recombinase XerD